MRNARDARCKRGSDCSASRMRQGNSCLGVGSRPHRSASYTRSEAIRMRRWRAPGPCCSRAARPRRTLRSIEEAANGVVAVGAAFLMWGLCGACVGPAHGPASRPGLTPRGSLPPPLQLRSALTQLQGAQRDAMDAAISASLSRPLFVAMSSIQQWRATGGGSCASQTLAARGSLSAQRHRRTVTVTLTLRLMPRTRAGYPASSPCRCARSNAPR
jgi:hypothetical protein